MSDQTNPTSTTFAGNSNPNTGRNIAWGAILASIVVAPVAALTALCVYFLFSFVRVSHKVLASFVVLYGLGLVVSGQIVNVSHLYLNSFVNILSALGGEELTSVILQSLLMQTPISLLIGGLVGVCFSYWAYSRRPVWVETNFRKTPVQLYRKFKNTNNIKHDKKSPVGGRTLGVNDDGERIVQTHEESEAHTLVCGGSGVGKTTTLLIGARDIIKRGESLVFVDMKGSKDVPEQLAMYAKRYGRKFYHWSSQNPHKAYDGPAPDGPAFYDPIGRGDPTRKTDLLMAGRDWSEDFYAIIIQNYLQLAFSIAEGAPLNDSKMDSFSEAIQLLDPQVLKKRSLKLVGNPQYTAIIQEINHLTDKKLDEKTRSTLDSMRSQLGILKNSIQGQWLKKDPDATTDINFLDAAHKGAVIVFSIDSATYEKNAKILGDLIIQDLKTVSAELVENKSRYPLNIFVDEFSAIGSDNIVTLLARCRAAGMPVTLSTQSLGDLRVVGEAFLDQLTGIISSFIVHRTNSLKDAEVYAGFGGKENKYVHRENVEMRTGLFGSLGSVGANTGKGTLEKVEDYIISPSDIQNLNRGEMYFIGKSEGRIEHVNVIREAYMKVSDENDYATSEEDKKWTPNEDEHVPTFDKDDIAKYTVDATINAPLIEKQKDEWNPNRNVEEKKSDATNLSRIFNKEKLRDNTEQEVSIQRSSAPTRSRNDITDAPVLGLTEAPPRSARTPPAPSQAIPAPEATPRTLRPAASAPALPERRVRATPPPPPRRVAASLPPRPEPKRETSQSGTPKAKGFPVPQKKVRPPEDTNETPMFTDWD